MRRPIPASQPTPYPTDALLQLTREVGVVAGTIGEITKGLDRVVQAQRDQAVATEQVSRDTADFRQETAETLGGIEARLAAGHQRMNDMQAEIAAMKGQKPEDRPPPEPSVGAKLLADAVSWIRTNWSWLAAIGGAIYGMYAAWKGADKKL